jgi:carboxypeptidase PM20D1
VRKPLLFGLLALLLLAAALVANTLRQGSRQVPAQPLPELAVDKAAVAESMAAAVRAKTVSGLLDPAGVAAEFDALHAHLKTRYPLVHEKLQREVVGGHSLLFTWKGSDDELQPVALMAHQDVVPIAPGTEPLWKKPPFAGVIEEGFVWGRGTLDDKSNLITQLEALELLLKAGFAPKRTVYFVYGHDEEVGGRLGVVKIVEQLQQRGVKLAWVMDEGLAVTEGILPGVKPPLALIGLAEKGSVTLKLVATAPPGHSSTPPAAGSSAIGMLSAALARLDQQPMPGGIQGAAAEMFAASDARHFDAIAEQSFRFMPIRFTSEDLKRVHGTDERISVDQLAVMVRFYHRLLTQAAQ